MGHGFRSCIHCAFRELIYVTCACFVPNMCDWVLYNVYMINGMWNTKVRKHNLRGSENKMNMKIWKFD